MPSAPTADDEPLDAIDLKILTELQRDGRIRNNELAERVGISPPPCLRRLRALRRRGFVRAICATLDEKLLGLEVTSFVTIQLKSQARTSVLAFEAAIMAMPHVQQCWQLSGDSDFLLKCHAPDVEDMHRHLLQFAAMPEVNTIRSLPVLALSKDAPLPLPEAPHPRPEN
jgi:DNA-binding Lrp family transcriptional regulator